MTTPSATSDQNRETRTLAATVAAITVSVAVALPAQCLWFIGKLVGGTNHLAFNPQTLMAFASPVLVEGLTWLCAVLYADSVHRGSPQRIYRLATLVFSGIAAAINFSHGVAISPIVGTVFALASLMGVGAWELYMLRSRTVSSGMSAEEIKLWALRWRKYGGVMRETGRIRAVFGLRVPLEQAWRMAYVRRVGNPTVPVALADERLRELFGGTDGGTQRTPEPEPPRASSGSGVTADVIEVPVDWGTMTSADDLIARFWPDVKAELDEDRATTAEPEPAGSSVPKPRRSTPEQGATRKVPADKRNPNRSRNTSRVQFRPTESELSGGGDVKARMLRYLARAEHNGQAVAELDRTFIASQFGVSDRHVRNTINVHREGNQG